MEFFMNNIPIFFIDLYQFRIKHVENINIGQILEFKIREHLITEIIHWYRFYKRKTLAKALSKGQVSGTGKKPFAQKGRGIARQGSLRNPHQRGGGVAFPPVGKKYSYKINKKKKYIALQSIVATRLKENRIKVIKNFNLSTPSTKNISLLLNNLKIKKVLFIDYKNINLTLSIRNISTVKFIRYDRLNIFELVLFPYILITKFAFSKLILRLYPKHLR